jgi:hypothetical protein
VLAAGVVVSLLAGAASAVPARAPAGEAAVSLDPFSGLGAWVSIYNRRARLSPERTVDALAGHGVRTLYLETANYRKPSAVVRPDLVARFVRSAHASGISVVGWYLPALARPAVDLRRAQAAASFSTPEGEGFDGFALDIEATVERSRPRRAANAVALTRSLRTSLPAGFPLAAITIAPVGSSPTYWGASYPFLQLAGLVDAFLPMEYFTFRTRGPRGVHAYSAANTSAIRRLAGDPSFPVHPIGGVTPRATAAEVRAFVAAAVEGDSIGASLWELGTTTPAEWAAIEGVGGLR